MSISSPLLVPLDQPRVTSPVQSGTRFHLSLNVSDIDRTVSFLQLVLGMPPAKQRTDYAKFELDSPPLVLSLERQVPESAGSLNHLGFRFATLPELLTAQQRIEAAGIPVRREEGVECCYARQTKFWIHDLDQRLWEFYVLEGDLEHRGGGQTLEQLSAGEHSCDLSAKQRRPTVWEHRMGAPLALPTATSDQIRLRGSFNLPISDAEISRILQDCFQNLSHGGQIELHMLTCEQPLTCPVELPGPAAYVRHVPVRTTLLEHLTAAGFVDCRLTTFRSRACFQLNGQALRETRIVATKPLKRSEPLAVQLIYRGPFAEIRDDFGQVWIRGVPAECSLSRWEQLQAAGLETAFTLIPQTPMVGACGQQVQGTHPDQGDRDILTGHPCLPDHDPAGRL